MSIAAIVTGFGDASETPTKGGTMTKRKIDLQDESGTTTLTVWRKLAMADPAIWQNNPVFACKNLKVDHFQGCINVSMLGSSTRLSMADVSGAPEVESLQAWWNARAIQGAGTKHTASEAECGNETPSKKRRTE